MLPIKRLFQIMDAFAGLPQGENGSAAGTEMISAPPVSIGDKVEIPTVEIGKEFVTPAGRRLYIDSLAGEGRRGKVYRAIDQGSRKECALKVIRKSGPLFLMSIKLEASKAATLAANQIPCAKILETGAAFVVKEWVEGASGEEWVRMWLDSGAEMRDAGFAALLHFFRDSAGRGICIRNLKPANMIFKDAAQWIPIDPGRIDIDQNPRITMRRYRKKFLRDWLGMNRLLAWVCNRIWR